MTLSRQSAHDNVENSSIVSESCNRCTNLRTREELYHPWMQGIVVQIMEGFTKTWVADDVKKHKGEPFDNVNGGHILALLTTTPAKMFYHFIHVRDDCGLLGL